MADPKVAYDPVPTAKPDMPRAAQINVAMPRIDLSDAIGRGMVALGHGYNTLGDQVKAMGSSLEHASALFEHAGDEIFKRGIALQEIDNETKVMEATSGYEIQQGQAEANFLSLKGNNAVGQYPAYAKSADELRRKVRDTLPNDASRRAFDNRTMPMLGRVIMQGARHMGAEQKNAYINGLGADVATWGREVSNHPFDEELTTKAKEGLRESINKKNDALGNPPNVAEVEFQEEWEKLLGKKFTAQSSERPFQTWDAWQETGKDQIHGPMRDQVEHTLLDNMRGAGSKYLADKETQDFRTGKPDTTRTITERVDEAMKSVPPQLRDDPSIRKNVQDRIEAIFNDNIKERQINRYNNTNEMYRILSGDGTGGKLPKNEEDFKADPKGKLVWDAEDDIGKEKIRNAIRLANQRAAYVDPVSSEVERRKWAAMAAWQPSEFFEKMQDPAALFGKMNPRDITQIRNLYEKMLKSKEVNPIVGKVEQWMHTLAGNTLTELGVDRLKRGQNDEDYWNFRGSILTSLEEWSAAHNGQMPTMGEFEKNIMPNLLKWKPQGALNWWTMGMFGEPGEEPFWKDAKVPPEWEQNRRMEIAIDRGLAPEDVPKEQIARDYLRHLYRESVKKRTPPSP